MAGWNYTATGLFKKCDVKFDNYKCDLIVEMLGDYSGIKSVSYIRDPMNSITISPDNRDYIIEMTIQEKGGNIAKRPLYPGEIQHLRDGIISSISDGFLKVKGFDKTAVEINKIFDNIAMDVYDYTNEAHGDTLKNWKDYMVKKEVRKNREMSRQPAS